MTQNWKSLYLSYLKYPYCSTTQSSCGSRESLRAKAKISKSGFPYPRVDEKINSNSMVRLVFIEDFDQTTAPLIWSIDQRAVKAQSMTSGESLIRTCRKFVHDVANPYRLMNDDTKYQLSPLTPPIINTPLWRRLISLETLPVCDRLQTKRVCMHGRAS